MASLIDRLGLADVLKPKTRLVRGSPVALAVVAARRSSASTTSAKSCRRRRRARGSAAARDRELHRVRRGRRHQRRRRRRGTGLGEVLAWAGDRGGDEGARHGAGPLKSKRPRREPGPLASCSIALNQPRAARRATPSISARAMLRSASERSSRRLNSSTVRRYVRQRDTSLPSSPKAAWVLSPSISGSATPSPSDRISK